MKRLIFLLSLLMLGCHEEIILIQKKAAEPVPVVRNEKPYRSPFRYNRIDKEGDSLFVWSVTPDKMYSYCYTYHHTTLVKIGVYDFAGETPVSAGCGAVAKSTRTMEPLDFSPKYYEIPVSDDYIHLASRYDAH